MLETAAKPSTTTTTAAEEDGVVWPPPPPRRPRRRRRTRRGIAGMGMVVFVATAIARPPGDGLSSFPAPAVVAAAASTHYPLPAFSSSRRSVATASFVGLAPVALPRPPVSPPPLGGRVAQTNTATATATTTSRDGGHLVGGGGAWNRGHRAVPVASKAVGVGPLFSAAPASFPSLVAGVGSVASAALRTSGVQKVLELGVVAAIGASLRDRLDAKAVTALLLNALVPAVIVSSLSTVRVSPDLGLVATSGALLTLVQIASGELASRLVIPIAGTGGGGNAGDGDEETQRTRRTAAAQLGTMAPALSVYSFTREFAGATYVGLAALADVPNKVYTLLLYPWWLRFRAARAAAASVDGNGNKGRAASSSAVGGAASATKPTLRKRTAGVLGDPFNLSIIVGLILAAFRRPVSSLGFAGRAVGSLAHAQTAILFLLIGLRLKFSGDRPTLCLRLLLARHGFVGLATSVFLRAFLPAVVDGGGAPGGRASRDAARLAVVLSSQAAASIVAFGQMSKVVEAEADADAGEKGEGDTGEPGYDVDLAFDIVALSFPLTVALNSAASLGGVGYVRSLPAVSAGLLAVSAALGLGGAGAKEKSAGAA